MTLDLCLLRFCSFSFGFPPVHQVEFTARLPVCFIKVASMSLYNAFLLCTGRAVTFQDLLFVDLIKNIRHCSIKHHKLPASALYSSFHF